MDRYRITTLMGKVVRIKIKIGLLEDKYAQVDGLHHIFEGEFHSYEHKHGELIMSPVKRIGVLECEKRGKFSE